MFLTLLGHDAATWTAWGTWAYTVFTLALAVGAFCAITVARKQLSALKEQIGRDADATGEQLSLLRQQIKDARESSEKQLRAIEEARLATTLPLVIPMAGKLVETHDGIFRVDIEIKNIGPGIAVFSEVEFWWMRAPESGELDPEPTHELIRRVWSTPPDGVAPYFRPLAPGEVGRTWIASRELMQPPVAFENAVYLLTWNSVARGPDDVPHRLPRKASDGSPGVPQSILVWKAD